MDQLSRSRPFFSIVIPTYNRRALLAQALDSVLRQDEQDFEVVVVNDGSTDDTDDFVASRYPRARLVRLPANMKRGVARNAGIDASEGRFLAFLDDDDLFEPCHLSQLKASAASGNYEAISTSATFWNPETNQRYPYKRPRLVYTDPRRAMLIGTALPLPSLAVSRTIATEVGGFPEQGAVDGSEDFVFLARLSEATEIKLLEKTSLVIRSHTARGMLRSEDIIASRLAAMDLVLRDGFRGRPLLEWERKWLAAGTFRFIAALRYGEANTSAARVQLRLMRREIGWWEGLRLGGRLWVQTLLGPIGVHLLRQFRRRR